MKHILRFLPVGLILLSVIFFALPFLFFGRLPIPLDTIVGLYHPYRDYFASEYPNGIPFKNFLITDPVRQQIPWRMLVLSGFSQMQLPLWNPYNAAGTPLLGNFQTGAFYPFNVVYIIFPFITAWTLQIFLQPLLGGIFLYLFLRKLTISQLASLLGGITFAFCGFSISWMTWNTLGHVVLWLPLTLLAIENLLGKWTVRWSIILVFSAVSSVFAGHLQMLLYCFVLSSLYIVCRIYQNQKRKDQRITFQKYSHALMPFGITALVIFVITCIQWLPTVVFAMHSARMVDQADWHVAGWFVPWQHLIQFVAPDFFGNPATLNYWGVWNYAELVGYVGVLPLVFAFFALFFRKDKKTLFFGTIFFLSLIFALPTFFARLPFLFSLPFFSSSQPTRLLFVTSFSLSVLAAFGFDFFLKNGKGIRYPIFFIGVLYAILWLSIIVFNNFFSISQENSIVARRNLFLPSGIFLFSVICIFLFSKVKKAKLKTCIACVMVLLVFFDLIYFARKFTPFVTKDYFYPQTKAITFLMQQKKPFRIMTTDNRILPPNFTSMYQIESVDVYDPLYLKRFGEFIIASERGKPDIRPPFGFNRIITPHNITSPLIDILGVTYLLSLTDLQEDNLEKVFQEGQVRVYKNKDVLPRSYFVKQTLFAKNKQEAIDILFRKDFHPLDTAVVEGDKSRRLSFLTKGKVSIRNYTANKIILVTKNDTDGFLVLTDTYYSSWKAYILTGEVRRETDIIRTNFNFRGIFVPKGENVVIFENSIM